jgi:hypothetical protein
MLSSGMLRHVALVRTDIMGEHTPSITRVTKIGANIPSSPILLNLMKEVLRSSETSVLTRATWCDITEYGILHSHRHENLKSYMVRM